MFFDDVMVQHEQDKIIARYKRITDMKILGIITSKGYEDSVEALAERIDKIILQKQGVKREDEKISTYRLLIRKNNIEKLLSELSKNVSLEDKSKLERTSKKYESLQRSNRMGIIIFNEYENRIEDIFDKINDVILRLKNTPKSEQKNEHEILVIKYRLLNKAALDTEFYNIASVPNARTNIDCLKKMVALMEVYESKGIQMPSNKAARTTKDSIQPQSGCSSLLLIGIIAILYIIIG